jgi:hypothetical protein
MRRGVFSFEPRVSSMRFSIEVDCSKATRDKPRVAQGLSKILPSAARASARMPAEIQRDDLAR